jgi:glycosyltransferase involved in cell wall biosynthesis
VDDEILPAWEALLEPAPGPVPPADSPLVSVVIPHHAQLELFAHTLRSVAAQDYPNLEIVVVDDGTPDDTVLEGLKELLDEPWGRPISFIRQDNAYLGAARNTGVRAAQADLLAFVDDDDIVEPHYVSTLVTAARVAGADAVSSVLVTHVDDGSDLYGSVGIPFVFVGDAVHLATSWNTIGGAGCLVRRQAWEAVGGFHTRHGVGHEDWTLLTSIALSGRTVISVPEPLYRYRIRRTSMLRSTTRYRNMRPVFDAFVPLLPPMFASWPELIHGQQQTIDDLWLRLVELETEHALLKQALVNADRDSAERDALLAEREGLYDSVTWKLGAVATAPARLWRRRRARP